MVYAWRITTVLRRDIKTFFKQNKTIIVFTKPPNQLKIEAAIFITSFYRFEAELNTMILIIIPMTAWTTKPIIAPVVVSFFPMATPIINPINPRRKAKANPAPVESSST